MVLGEGTGDGTFQSLGNNQIQSSQGNDVNKINGDINNIVISNIPLSAPLYQEVQFDFKSLNTNKPLVASIIVCGAETVTASSTPTSY